MAALSTIAMVGLAVTAVGTAYNIYSQSQAQNAAEDAANEQRKASAWDSARQTQQASAERRQQAREERIKRATILNQAANTGTNASSGATGAVMGMGSQLSSNMGTNQSMINSGQMITGFNQRAADFATSAGNWNNQAQLGGQFASLGTGLFQGVGGWKGLKSNERIF